MGERGGTEVIEEGKAMAAVMSSDGRKFISGDNSELWRGRQHGINEPLGKIGVPSMSSALC